MNILYMKYQNKIVIKISSKIVLKVCILFLEILIIIKETDKIIIINNRIRINQSLNNTSGFN